MVRRYRKRSKLRRGRALFKYGGRGRGLQVVRPLRMSGVHWFKESCQLPSITALGANNGSGTMTFKFNDLTNAPSYKALFDLYKITRVKIKIVPKANVSSADVIANANGQAGTLPMLYIAENRDPYVPSPTGVSDILNDDGVKIIRMTRPITLSLKSPKARVLSGLGTGATDVPIQFNVGSKWQPWLTTGGNLQVVDQSNTEHYGFRWFISNGVGNFEQVFDVYATYYFAMKEQD